MHSIQSEAQKEDFELRKRNTDNKTHIKYISFKNNTAEERVLGLKLNKLLNKWLMTLGTNCKTT